MPIVLLALRRAADASTEDPGLADGLGDTPERVVPEACRPVESRGGGIAKVVLVHFRLAGRIGHPAHDHATQQQQGDDMLTSARVAHVEKQRRGEPDARHHHRLADGRPGGRTAARGTQSQPRPR